MKRLDIMNTVTRTLNRTGLQLRKHSPELMVVGGVIGGVVAAVMACRATTRLSETLEESKEEIENIKYYKEHLDAPEVVGRWTEEDSKRDLAIAYTQAGLKLAKLYAPSVLIGAVSVAAILSGHNILRKRNIALATAYAGLSRTFKEYRGRVVERFGEELDKELRYNIKTKEVEETVTNEDGTETTVVKAVETADPTACSPYARFFDCGCLGWDKDPEINLLTLRKQQEYATQRLRTKGHLFLNEVYDMLGIQRSKAGNIVGWIYDEKSPIGDNYVDFGIYDGAKERNRAFVNGYERTILLDFNVDGPILDLI